MDYAGLQDKLVDLVEDTEVDQAKAREFIEQCEPKLDRDLIDTSNGARVPRQKMARVVEQTDSNGRYALPSDFHKARAVQVSSYRARYASPELVPTQSDGEPQDGFADATLVLDYYQQIPVLTNLNTSNWVLDVAPDVYLYGSALCYVVWRQNSDDLLSLYGGYYADAMKTLKATHSAQPRGGLRRQNGRNYGAFYTIIGEEMLFGRAR